MTTPPLRRGDRRHRLALIDGPNMSNLGARNKRVYGAISSIDDLHAYATGVAEALGVELTTFVSNYEGAILEHIHAQAASVDAFLINPAGLTEHGVPTKHALSETGKPFVELHFANIVAPPTAPRGLPIGPWQSQFTPAATGVAMGMREHSYAAAILGITLALDDAGFLGADL